MSETSLKKLSSIHIIVSKAITSATRRAINRALVSTRKFISTRVREELNVKASAVNDLISITNAGAGEDGKLEGSITVLDKPFQLVAFQPRIKRVSTSAGQRIGVTVQVRHARKLVKGGFLATMPSGHEGVFKRKGKNQYPIVELFSIGPASIVNDEAFMSEAEGFAYDRYRENFERDFDFLVTKGLEV